MKKIPNELAEIQNQKRKETAKAVTDAIIELQSQGYNIKIKDLLFVTGLSRSVFAKPHIRRILIEYGIVEPKELSSDEAQDKCDNSKQHKDLLAEKDGYIDRLLFENEQLKNECELLRGRIHLLTYKMSAMNNNDF